MDGFQRGTASTAAASVSGPVGRTTARRSSASSTGSSAASSRWAVSWEPGEGSSPSPSRATRWPRSAAWTRTEAAALARQLEGGVLVAAALAVGAAVQQDDGVVVLRVLVRADHELAAPCGGRPVHPAQVVAEAVLPHAHVGVAHHAGAAQVGVAAAAGAPHGQHACSARAPAGRTRSSSRTRRLPGPLHQPERLHAEQPGRAHRVAAPAGGRAGSSSAAPTPSGAAAAAPPGCSASSPGGSWSSNSSTGVRRPERLTTSTRTSTSWPTVAAGRLGGPADRQLQPLRGQEQDREDRAAGPAARRPGPGRTARAAPRSRGPRRRR